MIFSNQSRISENKKLIHNQKLAHFIMRLKSTLNISSDEMRENLRLTSKEYLTFITGKKDISAYAFCDLAEKFEFSIDAFYDNRIDFEAIKQHHLGNDHYLPEGYLVGAFSKKQLIITILDFVEKYYGWQFKDNILNYFQLRGSIYNSPNDAINVYLFEQMLDYLVRRGLSQQDIIRIGHHSINTTVKSKLAQSLRDCRSQKELYELYLTELIELVELNNRYEVTKLDDDFCEITVHEIKDNLDIFKVKHIGGPRRCDYRVGALSSATRYMNLACSEVIETKCCHRGDDKCVYHINFGNSHVLKKSSSIYH